MTVERKDEKNSWKNRHKKYVLIKRNTILWAEVSGKNEERLICSIGGFGWF